MIFSLLASSPALAIAFLVAILLSLTVHEFSHGLVAYWRGDRTAEYAGRLTLNPLSHIDPIGFIALLFLGFGWAKPVPYNPYNLRDAKWDSVRVALAGPISNFLLAGVCAFLLRALVASGAPVGESLLPTFLLLMIVINLGLAYFNLIPIHPLDGSKLALALLDAPRHARIREFILRQGSNLLIFLILLSFLPGLDVFGFLSRLVRGTCSLLVGGACL